MRIIDYTVGDNVGFRSAATLFRDGQFTRYAVVEHGFIVIRDSAGGFLHRHPNPLPSEFFPQEITYVLSGFDGHPILGFSGFDAGTNGSRFVVEKLEGFTAREPWERYE